VDGMKPISITKEQWKKLLLELHNDYPPSVLAIREKTKRVLGFTPREHTEWVDNPKYAAEYKSYLEDEQSSFSSLFLCEPQRKEAKKMIKLDFYDEAKRTFFLIKYSEFLK
jgi:hypothetical protein